jgi:hypothetical protein
MRSPADVPALTRRATAARAGEPKVEPGAARRTAEAVRGHLPAPTPALKLLVEGDVVARRRWIGTLRIEARATRWDLHLGPEAGSRAGAVSPGGALRVVAAGLGGARVTVDPTAPADTWKKAFLRFGFGYHRADRELLRSAFHGQRMYDHEVHTLGRWPADRPLEPLREAWMREFLAGSKHRDRASAQRLLSMTLATGEVVRQTQADEVVFRAHPDHGGGVHSAPATCGAWTAVGRSSASTPDARRRATSPRPWRRACRSAPRRASPCPRPA